MERRKITAGGQISLPAGVRRRWATSSVAVEDRGDHVVITPFPDDPIGAIRGRWKGQLPSTSELRERARADEAAAERRRQRI